MTGDLGRDWKPIFVRFRFRIYLLNFTRSKGFYCLNLYLQTVFSRLDVVQKMDTEFQFSKTIVVIRRLAAQQCECT